VLKRVEVTRFGAGWPLRGGLSQMVAHVQWLTGSETLAASMFFGAPVASDASSDNLTGSNRSICSAMSLAIQVAVYELYTCHLLGGSCSPAPTTLPAALGTSVQLCCWHCCPHTHQPTHSPVLCVCRCPHTHTASLTVPATQCRLVKPASPRF